MEIRQLQCFLAVAETLNFSRAAKMLFLSQPTVSRQIAELESGLGFRLFDRNKSSVSLTKAGVAFYPEAKDLVQRHDALTEKCFCYRQSKCDSPK